MKSGFHLQDQKKSTQNLYLFYFLLVGFICLFACSKEEEDPEEEIREIDISVELPEPSIEELTARGRIFRFKLTQLSVVKEKVFKINDNIVFSGLTERIRKNSSLREVQLKIKTNCVLDTGLVLVKNVTRPLSPAIPLIELLPLEALSTPSQSAPSCGFSFKAENKAGSAHHFEIPPLPIADFSHNRFIRMIHLRGEEEHSSRYIVMDSRANYWIDTGVEEPINHLKLVCTDFTLELSIRSQQFLPFSVFPFYKLEETMKARINKGNSQQNCRLFGFVNQVLAAVSYFFRLV